MAYNYTNYAKQNKWKIEKQFDLKNVVKNLQTYELVSGKTNVNGYAKSLESYGFDAKKISQDSLDIRLGNMSQLSNNNVQDIKEKEQHTNHKRPKQLFPIPKIDKNTKTVVSSPKPILLDDFSLDKDDLISLPNSINNNNNNNTITQTEQEQISTYNKENKSKVNLFSYCQSYSDSSDSDNNDTTSELSPSHNISIDNPKESFYTSSSELSNCTNNHENINIDNQKEKKNDNIEEQDNRSDKVEEEKEEEIRFAGPGEPECIICGKYADYIEDKTGESICSKRCKDILLSKMSIYTDQLKEKAQEDHLHVHVIPSLQLSDPIYVYNKEKCRYKQVYSEYDTSKCPYCHHTGHLAKDCIYKDIYTNSNDVYTDEEVVKSSIENRKEWENLQVIIHAIKENISSYKCTICGCQHNLVYCVKCKNTFCDSIHLCSHLLQYPSHNQLYSLKLKRMIKCCNKFCCETNIYKLKLCTKCLQNIWDRYYKMESAMWDGNKVYSLMNCIACENHFDWHIFNCNASTQNIPFVSSEQVQNLFKETDHCVSEYYF
ncbi:hypothetical protein WA158_002371 [Blastocystis sp. Blastoise]